MAALASGLVIALTGWTPIDPILSLCICALILTASVRLLRGAVHVVMEGVPAHVQLGEVGRRLSELDGVLGVHDLHVWTIASGHHAIAAHVQVRSLEHWPEQLRAMQAMLREEWSIDHVTLQPEPPYSVTLVPLSELTDAPPAAPAAPAADRTRRRRRD